MNTRSDIAAAALMAVFSALPSLGAELAKSDGRDIAADAWGFASAPWVGSPKIFGKLNCDGQTLFVTDGSWRAYDSPIIFNGLRNGEWATRVLAEYGHADDAFRMFVQPETPGWAHWLQFGDGTLHETWNSSSSHNHLMFGDLSAWASEYAAGIVPREPGFRKIAFRPHVLEGVDFFVATYQTPSGKIRAGWRRVDGKVEFICEVPEGVEAESDSGIVTTLKDNSR